jgi:phosphocarrier protein FPr
MKGHPLIYLICLLTEKYCLALVIAYQLAAEVDVSSIGSNDLSRYVMAADRTNPRVATLANALHLAVLQMIYQTVKTAHQAGIWTGICGELAADPLAIAILGEM